MPTTGGRVRSFLPYTPIGLPENVNWGAGRGKRKGGERSRQGEKNGGGEQKVPIFVAEEEEEEVTRAGNLGPP